MENNELTDPELRAMYADLTFAFRYGASTPPITAKDYNEFRDWEIENFGPDPELFPEEAEAFWADKSKS